MSPGRSRASATGVEPRDRRRHRSRRPSSHLASASAAWPPPRSPSLLRSAAPSTRSASFPRPAQAYDTHPRDALPTTSSGSSQACCARWATTSRGSHPRQGWWDRRRRVRRPARHAAAAHQGAGEEAATEGLGRLSGDCPRRAAPAACPPTRSHPHRGACSKRCEASRGGLVGLRKRCSGRQGRLDGQCNACDAGLGRLDRLASVGRVDWALWTPSHALRRRARWPRPRARPTRGLLGRRARPRAVSRREPERARGLGRRSRRAPARRRTRPQRGAPRPGRRR